MSDFGIGGNPNFGTGQVAMSSTAQTLVFPTATLGLNGGPDNLRGMRVTLTAGTADCYVGGAGVTTSSGHRIPLDTSQSFFIGRSPLYVIGTSGTLTWLLEYA